MNRIHCFTAVTLLAALTVTPVAFGQSTAAAQAARLQKLKAQQAAVLARVKAAQATATTATAAPTAAPTTAPTPVATVAPKLAPTAVVAPPATVAPKATTAPNASAPPSASAAPASSASTAPVTTALALDLDALKKTHTDRRHTEVLDLESRWGALASDPRSAAELKLHAQRSAYLQRIRALGEKAKDATFVKSVDALITKEDTRDADAMNALRSGALPAGTAAIAAPAAGASK